MSYDAGSGGGSRPCLRWQVWEVYHTQHDERVCPVCGPHNGKRYQQGQGPIPPLHLNCRCWREEVERVCIEREPEPVPTPPQSKPQPPEEPHREEGVTRDTTPSTPNTSGGPPNRPEVGLDPGIVNDGTNPNAPGPGGGQRAQ